MPTMRLAEVDRGDRLGIRLLFRFISTVSRARFPDAARVAFYHRSFAGPELNAWTQHAMRGKSEWSVAERELMAAMVAQWNSCYANALDFELPTDKEFARSSGILLKRGYG